MHRARPLNYAALLIGLVAACSPSDSSQLSASSTGSLVQAAADARPRRSARLVDGTVIADTFTVRHALDGDRLTLVLETDLPDDAVLMVSATRLYKERGSNEDYGEDYFSERSTVGAWREARTITLDNEEWAAALEEKRALMARIGEPFTVARISDKIEVRFVLPVGQMAPFEKRNANLQGAAVKTSTGGLRIVEAEVEIPYPLKPSKLVQTEWANPLDLGVGKRYALPREIPLMPSPNPTDAMAAIAQIRRLPAKTQITVLEVQPRRGTPWYRVRAAVPGESWEGWINSTALVGQQIAVAR